MASFPTALSDESSLALHSLTWWKCHSISSLFLVLACRGHVLPLHLVIRSPKRLLPCDYSPLCTVSSPISIAWYFCFCSWWSRAQRDCCHVITGQCFITYLHCMLFLLLCLFLEMQSQKRLLPFGHQFSFHVISFSGSDHLLITWCSLYFIWFVTHLVFNFYPQFPLRVVTYDEPTQCVHLVNFLWSQYLTAFRTHNLFVWPTKIHP